MALRTSLYRMTERAVGGDLEALLRSLRASGESYEGIARKLAGEGAEVTSVTIRAWCRRLGIEGPVASEPDGETAA